MASLFWTQLSALIWKNWIMLSKHSFFTLLRCLVLPIAYGVFLAYAQVFLHRLNYYGIGEPVAVSSLNSQFDGKTFLMWADATDGTSNPSPAEVMARITSNFTVDQLTAVKKLGTPSEIPAECLLNFNGVSQCFAGISFADIPPNRSTSSPVNYTIFADAGLNFIDVEHHTSDFEKRILPLQWSIDQAIIELQTGIVQETPMEWPYTNMTNTEQKTNIRLSYVRGIRNLIALALFINFIGVSYQIPGSVAGERAMLITEHMKAMGLLDSARILSWHLSISLTYLPAWIAVGVIWKYFIFVETNAGLIIVLHLLLGLVLASWSFVVAIPFSTSPQLAAVVATFLAIVLAILGLVMKTSNTGALFVFSVIFPPSFYIFSLKAICGYENHQLATNALSGDPDRGIVFLPLLIAAVVDVFLWPVIAVVLERCLYEARGPVSFQKPESWDLCGTTQEQDGSSLPQNAAVSIRNLTKTYKTSILSSKKDVTAVKNLSLDIPKTGIFVILGSNGAGKSTALSIIGGLSKITSGMVTFEGGHVRPPRGTLGIVPQKNVLFPHLTCLQTLRVWKAVKWSQNSFADEDLEQLLRDCDLEKKINANAATLSGGQKRKLQLAIGLLGGSKIVLVDECTSGVDPLSRRALWKTLTAFREERCIVFTTHFLDEADLLADQIAILAPPGKVVASGSPVKLKRDLGEGYSIQVWLRTAMDYEKIDSYSVHEMLQNIRTIAPQTHISTPTDTNICFHLKTRDNNIVSQILDLLDAEAQSERIISYDILGTTLEDIFLDLMNEDDAAKETSLDTISAPLPDTAAMDLPSGRQVSSFGHAFTIFRKRVVIAKRSWLSPLLTVLVAVAGSCIPLVFIVGEQLLCVQQPQPSGSTALYLPYSPLSGRSSHILESPPGIIETLGHGAGSLSVTSVADNATFVREVSQNYRNLSLGGVSLDMDSGSSLVAWEGTPPGIRGAAMLNLATNILYNRALNLSGNAAGSPAAIQAEYATFSKVSAATLVYLRWMFFFGAVMAVYPAFYSLYVSRERTSSVQAMQFSNGLTSPVGLWLGHLMFDAISAVLLSTIIIIIFATVSNQFYGLGFLWLNLVLYGVTGALFAYCLSLMVSSPLAAFAIVAGYQFIMFILYLSAYLFILTFGTVGDSANLFTIVHFSISVVAPVASITRAALVSTNLFSLACNGDVVASPMELGSIKRYGGTILYLVVYAFVLLAILVWVDTGSRKPRLQRRKEVSSKKATPSSSADDVVDADSMEASDELLRVLNVSKAFKDKQVADDVSLSLSRDTIFALLGPNGAGKTTIFNIIRGNILPDCGDVLINGTSIVRHPRVARSALGVCPQFTAIDSQLTVREHLTLYGRLKGLRRGQELESSIEAVLEGTGLKLYADRLASKLSGGNQRKLSLAICLLGNPLVILIDEFSTGVDAKMKRDMWEVLRKVAIGKAIVITTHSMEEASAIASKVGILAKHMLAIGTTESLCARYASYEVHFSCRTREDVVKARALMALIPGSRMAEDVATRFEVPITRSDGLSLANLFNTLASHGDFMEYTVERPSLESVFLKVIRENNIREEDNDRTDRSRRSWWRC
ncbi:hypothetical protein BDZ97DRAFT_1650923 [Flammula alnicola]|nr:hypothetical protein BDZ97DRAFT_1650923 [Flammula alnicola]